MKVYKYTVSQVTPIGKHINVFEKVAQNPFGGSGVVMEEALKLQRKVHTIDISENSINNFILPKLDKGLIYEQRTY